MPSAPKQCRQCQRWFVPNPTMHNVSCTVHHGGGCCHYSDTEVPAPRPVSEPSPECLCPFCIEMRVKGVPLESWKGLNDLRQRVARGVNEGLREALSLPSGRGDVSEEDVSCLRYVIEAFPHNLKRELPSLRRILSALDGQRREIKDL